MNTPKTHPLNVSYLVVGLVFLGISGAWALRSSGAVDAGDLRWLAPLVLVAAGAIGLVAFAAKGLGRGHATGTAETAEPSYDLYGPYSYDVVPDTDTNIDTDTEQTTVLPDHPEGDHR